VSFRVSSNPHTNHNKTHAEDVAPVFPMSELEDLAGYRETSEVVSKINGGRAAMCCSSTCKT